MMWFLFIMIIVKIAHYVTLEWNKTFIAKLDAKKVTLDHVLNNSNAYHYVTIVSKSNYAHNKPMCLQIVNHSWIEEWWLVECIPYFTFICKRKKEWNLLWFLLAMPCHVLSHSFMRNNMCSCSFHIISPLYILTLNVWKFVKTIWGSSWTKALRSFKYNIHKSNSS
jgi:hypothetical protein